MIKFKQSGSFNNTERLLTAAQKLDIRRIVDRYASNGVSALAEATPQDTGRTAESWSYKINVSSRKCTITWSNSNVTDDGIPIVILLQYGHGNGKGGYVQGRDFINPAIQPVFDRIAENLWTEVSRL